MMTFPFDLSRNSPSPKASASKTAKPQEKLKEGGGVLGEIMSCLWKMYGNAGFHEVFMGKCWISYGFHEVFMER